MTVLSDKEATSRLERVRYWTENDPAFWAMGKRGQEDLEERTKDLDRIFSPARGFRVRQTLPSSASIEVEAGTYVSGTAISQVSLQTLAVPATGSPNRRIDLVYLNLKTGAVIRLSGSEANQAFSALPRPSLPLASAVPLAYLYVDEVPTPFDDSLLKNTAGAIEDIRPALGASTRILEDSAGNLKTDTTSGSAGVLTTVSRADHRHPLNVDATTGTQINPSTTANAGSSSTYSRANHRHNLRMATSAAQLKKDAQGGSLGGSEDALVHADHQHPLNVSDAVTPSSITPGASSAPGASQAYSRADHVHGFSSNINLKVLTWTSESDPKSTGAMSFTPKGCIVLMQTRSDGDTNQVSMSIGLATGLSSASLSKAVAVSNQRGASTSDWSVGSDDDAAGGYVNVDQGEVIGLDIDVNITTFSASGITLDPTGTITATAYLLIFG